MKASEHSVTVLAYTIGVIKVAPRLTSSHFGNTTIILPSSGISFASVRVAVRGAYSPTVGEALVREPILAASLLGTIVTRTELLASLRTGPANVFTEISVVRLTAE